MSDKRTDKLLEKADKVHKKELDSHTIKYIRNKKLKDMTREELTLNRRYTLELIKESNNQRTIKQECKYLDKIENEILRRNKK